MAKRSARFLLLLIFGALPVLAAPPKKPSPVTVVEVASQSLRQEVSLTGSAEPLRQSPISTHVEGVVEQVFVTEGDRIEAGQKILVLDRAIAEIDVASGRAMVDEALARHKDATRRKDEYQSLIDKKHVSATSLASAVADEEATKAALARQRAELSRVKELLSRHTLSAPFSGIVATKNVEVGQWVKTDSPVIQLVALDTIRIRAPLPQRYFQKLTKGAEARLQFDALPGETFTGKISALVGVGNQQSRSFPVFIDIDNTKRRIAPGMSARIDVELSGAQSEALLVPRDAVVIKADGSRIVWRVTEIDGQSKANPLKVLIGRAQSDQVEVLDSDLKPGDRIVMLGNENLRPGQQVRLSQSNDSTQKR